MDAEPDRRHSVHAAVVRRPFGIALAIAILACTPTRSDPDPDGAGAAATPATPAAAAGIVGVEWRLVELEGRAALASSASQLAHFQFDGEGRVSGSTGCNRFSGPSELAGDSVSFGALATTRMACVDPAANEQERSFLLALERATTLHLSGDTLTLATGGQPLARFAARR